MKKILLAILSMSSVAFTNAQTSGCTELFISEVVEGSGNNKAIEIYNPTSAPIALSNYRIVRCSNGSSIGSDSLQLTGTIAAHDVWVVVNGQTTSTSNSPACDTVLQNMGDQLGGAYPDPLYENGNDALVLVKISPYSRVDIFGKIGEDPGQSWSDAFPYTDAQGSWWTKDHTLIRKSTVTGGIMTNPTAFNITTEWDSLPNNTWTNLGIHVSTCISSGITEPTKNNSVSAFPNPSTGTFTVSAGENMKKLDVYNALGELVYSKQFSSSENQQQIDLSSQQAGLYIMQVELSSGRRVTSKISIR